MKSTVEQLSPHPGSYQRGGAIRSSLSRISSGAYKELAKHMRLPGSARKAPAKLPEARIGREAMLIKLSNDKRPRKRRTKNEPLQLSCHGRY